MSDLEARLASLIASVAREYPILGLALTAHRSMRAEPLSFAGRPFLVEPYANARKFDLVVFRKAVQTGVSELAIQYLLDSAGWRGRTVAYVLPTYKNRNRFVQTRVNPLLVEVREYRNRCPGGSFGVDKKARAESLGLKKFGRGNILFLSSYTANDFVEFSADTLIIDEYDHNNQANLALANDRLREARDPARFLIGNPTRPREGICAEYDLTDRRRYYHTCAACGTRQPLDWWAHVVRRDDRGVWQLRDQERAVAGPVRPVCIRCKRPFDRGHKALWVQENPNGTGIGYAMSRLDILTDDLRALFREFLKGIGDRAQASAFIRGALGLGSEEEGARLTFAMLEAVADAPELDAIGGPAYEPRTITAGIDVGSVLHTMVSERVQNAAGNVERRGVFSGTIGTFPDVRDLLKRFRVDLAVCDANPEIHNAQDLRDHFAAIPADEPGGNTYVWLCRFNKTERVGAQRFGMKLDHYVQLVQVDRTSVLDAAYDEIATGIRRFPLDIFTVDGFSDQMCMPVRVNENGRMIWTKGVDHYRLADVYDMIAGEILNAGGTFSSI